MKKSVLFLVMLATAMVSKAQSNVDNFEVGPYVVDYYLDNGEYLYKLKKDIDLYDYFGLKRDTIINVISKNELVTHGIELNFVASLPRCIVHGGWNLYGVEGKWKQRIANRVYANAGLSLAYGGATYDAEKLNTKDNIFEAGLPLSIEFGDLSRNVGSVYVGVGAVPTYYSVSGKNEINGKEVDHDKLTGIFVAPRIDLGAYVPFYGQCVHIGIFYQNNISFASDDKDVIKERMGRSIWGASLGILF